MKRKASRNGELDDIEEIRLVRKSRVKHLEDVGAGSEDLGSAFSIAHTASRLLLLLDFTSLTSREDISARFDTIALELLHHFLLRVRCVQENAESRAVYKDYEILELEFYLHSPGLHEDPFTHGSDEQRCSGRWYFHRTHPALGTMQKQTNQSSAAGGYRGGTRKGLDLTLGGPAEDMMPRTSKFFSSTSTPPKTSRSTAVPHGGILLRTLRRRSDQKVISGPSLLVDEILKVNKAHSIADLVLSKWGGDTKALTGGDLSKVTVCLYPMSNGTGAGMNARVNLNTYLQDSAVNASRSSVDLPRTFRSPRIGLDLSHASIPLPSANNSERVKASIGHPRAIYISKPYRYFTHPDLLTSNGRGHTFLGVYQSLAQERRGRGDVQIIRDVVKITGLKPEAAQVYLNEYRKGQASGNLSAFVGPKGKGAGSSAASLLRMMGTLEYARAQSSRNPTPCGAGETLEVDE